MKGHLDVKELEKYKKADLQKLAEELGVSAEGTIKEIAARCAEVEVEIPEESELTEEEKAAAEQAAAEYEEKNEREETEKDDERQEVGAVTVEVTEKYLDRALNQIKKPGEVFTVSRERAAALEKAKVARAKE